MREREGGGGWGKGRGRQVVTSMAGQLSHSCVILVPCNLETSRSLQTACHAVCRLRGHRFNELHARVCFGEITSKKTERIVMIL